MKSRKKNWSGFFRSNYPFLLAFFLPVFIMILIFAGKSIFPFGDNSFLRTDMYHQYAPFFSEFWEKLHTGGSLTYSWDIGLGTNFTALFGYYLSSPVNWFVFFCPRGFIIEFMTYLIVIKIGLCGFTMSWYLSKHFRSKEPGVAVFGILYALCGYMAAYSWNIMWLDCLWLAPLILWGLERLIQEGKGFFYCITLGLCILSNYYISIMVCIFLVLYFIASLLMLPTKQSDGILSEEGEAALARKRTGYIKPVLRFVLYSLLAGGLAACILIPEISALGLTASGDFSFPKSLSSYFSAFDMLVRHLMPVAVETGLDHWPNLYSGLIVLPLFVLYIMDRNIYYKEKIVKCGLLLLFLASFSMNIPNFIWHGFHYPNSLPCRQSFLYTLVLLTMCYEAYRNLRTFTRGQLTAAICIPAAFILLAEKLTQDNGEIPFYVFYISLAIIGLYGILAYLYKRRKAAASTLAILFFGLILLESAVNTAVTSVTITSRSSYLRNTEEARTLLSQAKEEDPSFYRVEKENRKTKNDGAFTGYHSASVFSSTANANITQLYKDLGLEGSTNAYSFNGATPLIKALFGVKYTITTRSQTVPLLEQIYGTEGEVNLIENLYTLPVGYMVSSDLIQFWDGGSSKVEAQNSFVALSATEGTGDLFLPVESTSSGSMATIPIDEDGYYVAEIPSGTVEDVTVTKNGSTQTWSDIDRGYLIDLGYCTAGTTITVSAGETDASLRLSAYRMDTELFISYVQDRQEQGMTVDSWSDTSISGQVTAKEDGYLLLTVPYEEGGTLYVDGAKTEITPFRDALISVPLSAGTHTISLHYEPAGLRTGIMLSIVSIALLLFIYCLKKLFTAWKQEKAGEEKPARIQDEPLEELNLELIDDTFTNTDIDKEINTDIDKEGEE